MMSKLLGKKGDQIKTNVKQEKKWADYRCTVCGYVYDPDLGDPISNIKPGTPFEELPADWVCPICGAEKDKFIKEI